MKRRRILKVSWAPGAPLPAPSPPPPPRRTASVTRFPGFSKLHFRGFSCTKRYENHYQKRIRDPSNFQIEKQLAIGNTFRSDPDLIVYRGSDPIDPDLFIYGVLNPTNL